MHLQCRSVNVTCYSDVTFLFDAVEEEPEERLGKTHNGVFSKDLPWLMYGFGDADKPIKVGAVDTFRDCWIFTMYGA
jgi:hypothetical protein